MDFKELAEKIGLEEDEFMELVELFISTSTSDLSKLQSAVNKGNVQEVVEAAHSIKGASGNMGFLEVYEAVKGLEMNARENNLEGAEDGIRIIKERLDLISGAMSV